MTPRATTRATSRPTAGCTCYAATSGLVRFCALHESAEALLSACETVRDFIRREYGWPPRDLWAAETLATLDAVIERAEGQP